MLLQGAPFRAADAGLMQQKEQVTKHRRVVSFRVVSWPGKAGTTQADHSYDKGT